MRPRYRTLMIVGGLLLLAGAVVGCHKSSSGSDGQVVAFHADVPLRDRLGRALTPASTEPYSPRKTCGFCHDVDQMANAYHFQQGRTDLAGKLVTKDDYFNDGRAFLQSAGMYGKW
jgi:hypothetical protein